MTVGVEVEVRVTVAVGESVGVDVEVAVGSSGLGVADGLAAADRLQALSTTIPAITSQRMGVGRRASDVGMAYRESVGQPKSRSNVPKVS